MARKPFKFKLNQLYLIRILDHCVRENKPVTISVVGYIVEDAKDYVVLSPWHLESDNQEEVNFNNEIFTLIKSCVISKKILK